jgi:hypothetical protein
MDGGHVRWCLVEWRVNVDMNKSITGSEKPSEH